MKNDDDTWEYSVPDLQYSIHSKKWKHTFLKSTHWDMYINLKCLDCDGEEKLRKKNHFYSSCRERDKFKWTTWTPKCKLSFNYIFRFHKPLENTYWLAVFISHFTFHLFYYFTHDIQKTKYTGKLSKDNYLEQVYKVKSRGKFGFKSLGYTGLIWLWNQTQDEVYHPFAKT